MKGFNGELASKYLGTRHGVPMFETTKEVIFNYGLRPICVPVGTVTDIRSTPWYLHWLCPRLGPYDQAAVVHDYILDRTECSRFIADAIFREAMAVLGMPWWRRVMMWYGVRAYAVLTGKK